MDIPVLLAVHGQGETALVSALAAAPGLTVARRCADVTELLAAAGAGVGAIAVVSASHLGIDRVLVDRLHQMDVRVLGLAHAEDAERVATLGCDAVVDAAAPPANVVGAMARLRSHQPPPPPPRPRDPRAGGGLVVTVWGTHGAPGRTTLAINLAHALSRHGTVGLVDADTVAPAVAQSLGILEESSAIAIAARAASNGRLDRATLARCFPRVGPIGVMGGLTRADRWREVPGAALEVVLQAARDVVDFAVVDVAGGWEAEESRYDTGFAPPRQAAQIAALTHSDVVVAVGAGDPVGIHRLITLLADRPRIAGREVVVVNKVRAAVAGPAAGNAVREALARFGGVTDPVVIPDDRAGTDAALLAADFLAVAARKSPALAGMEELARRVRGVPARRRERARAAAMAN